VSVHALPLGVTAFAAAVVAGCATESLDAASPRTVTGFPVAPYEIHEECAQLVAGDRIDFRFEAQAPVSFHIYYKDGITFVSPVSRSDIREYSGVFRATSDRRYCLQWEAGRQGALLDYRLRLLRIAGTP